MDQQNQKTIKKSQEDKEVKDKKTSKPKRKVSKNVDEHVIDSFGQKVRILNDISTVDGTLHKDEIVKVESGGGNGMKDLKVIDTMGRVWYVNTMDISTKI